MDEHTDQPCDSYWGFNEIAPWVFYGSIASTRGGIRFADLPRSVLSDPFRVWPG
ncbi:MAG: hypothetical protein WD028_01960 [Balneolaceae bacterium]